MPESFVIAISAVSGGGKTTLVKKTAELLEATTLFFDSYASVSEYPKDIIQWINDGADLNEWKTPVFARDVAALKRGESIIHPVANDTIESNEFIVIEDPVGRGRNEMAYVIDFMVLIDTLPKISYGYGAMLSPFLFSVQGSASKASWWLGRPHISNPSFPLLTCLKDKFQNFLLL